MADLAGATHLSARYFSLAFKQTYGVTPHARLIGCRIARAQELMRSTLTAAMIGEQRQSNFPEARCREFVDSAIFVWMCCDLKYAYRWALRCQSQRNAGCECGLCVICIAAGAYRDIMN